MLMRRRRRGLRPIRFRREVGEGIGFGLRFGSDSVALQEKTSVVCVCVCVHGFSHASLSVVLIPHLASFAYCVCGCAVKLLPRKRGCTYDDGNHKLVWACGKTSISFIRLPSY